jgi:hypothetical protein
MLKIFKTLLLLFFSIQLLAQEDTLFVYPKSNSFVIMCKANNGDNIFSLSRRFHVPPALLADFNGLTYQSGIANGSLILIPLGAYNELRDRPANMEDAKPLYYKVADEDNLYKISKYADVSQHVLQEWNDLPDNNVRSGQRIFVGWVLFDATGMSAQNKPAATQQTDNTVKAIVKVEPPATQKPNTVKRMVKQVIQNADGTTTTIYKAVIDTLKPMDTLYLNSPYGINYLQQTDSDSKVDSEKGAAVFFDAKVPAAKNVYYAFHNNTPRGTIIKVYFTNAQKFILVKVIGPIPDSKQYYGSIIAIGGFNKEQIKVQEDKTWCEIRFAKQKVAKPGH